MRKLIAAINMTVDGFCDHTAGIADDEIHEHYAELLRNAGACLYGRVTYQLMENAWPAIAKAPTGNKATDDFAVIMDNVSKIVFSRSLQTVDWKNSTLKKEIDKDEILELKQQTGKDMYAGSPGLIIALANLNLIDEYQLCIHPVALGNGQSLFGNMRERIDLKLLKTKIFGCGAVLGYYEVRF